MQLKPTIHRGRAARLGSICFNGDKMAVFAGYHPCPNCGKLSRIQIDYEYARTLARNFGAGRKVPRFKIVRY
jgi:hypothetical protein